MIKETVPWGKIALEGSPFTFSFTGNHSIEIDRAANETLLTSAVNDEHKLHRFVTGTGNDIFLEPGLPELPIILKPSQYISVLPSKKLEAFVEVPMKVKILYGHRERKILLHELNLGKLSRSFFGGSETGEFAYFIESPLNRKISDYDNCRTSIYCPLTISNKSSQNLEFEKMILRVPYLSIYQHMDVLIASPVNITFRGQEQISQIIYRKSPPVSEEALKRLSAPRMEEDKNILRRSFYFIKNLYTG